MRQEQPTIDDFLQKWRCLMNRHEELLIEEYKILENRYGSETGRIWSQAHVLILVNLIGIIILSAVLSDNTKGAWLVDFRLVLVGGPVVGLFLSLGWYFGLATENAYHELSFRQLCRMEKQLDLPAQVFNEAQTNRQQFRWWQRMGMARILRLLALLFVAVWAMYLLAGIWQALYWRPRPQPTTPYTRELIAHVDIMPLASTFASEEVTPLTHAAIHRHRLGCCNLVLTHGQIDALPTRCRGSRCDIRDTVAF